MPKSKIAFIVFLFVSACIIGVCNTLGLLINDTESMPLGLYQITEDENVNVDKGNLIVFNIPQKHERLLKKVIAVENDHVVVDQEGVHVNGILLANSKIFFFDSKGHPLTPMFLNKHLEQNEIFAMGDHIQSYDSRYFGTVYMQANNIKKVRLLYSWSRTDG